MKNCYTCHEYGACNVGVYTCPDWKELGIKPPLRINIIKFNAFWKAEHAVILADKKLDDMSMLLRVTENYRNLKGIDPDQYIENAEKALKDSPKEDLLTVSGT